MGKIRTKVGFEGRVREIEIEIPDDEPEPWGADARLSVVGTDVPRVDGPLKVTGRAKYTYDVNLRDLLHAKILHAPMGAALIASLDTSEAERLPGVKGVHVFKGRGRPIQHHGDEILAIAAETEEQAEDALKAVRIEYEMRPVVTTIPAAMRPGAPRVYASRDNVVPGKQTARREAERFVNEAERIVEATYETQVQTHSSLEPHGAVARIEADGSMTVWCSTQATFLARQGAAAEAGARPRDVKVIAEHVGGGFGSKFALGPSGVAAVRLAKKTGRPVKCMLTREGEHTTGGNRPSSIQKFRGGLDRDGRIRGVIIETHGTAGVAQGGSGCAHPNIYELGVVQKTETHVFTNGGPGCAMRAPGYPQGIFALDCFMDEMAQAVGMDPLEFRQRNCKDEVYLAQWELGAQKIGWKERRNPRPGEGRGPLRRGVGMASSRWAQRGSPGHEVEVIVGRDGAVEVRNGAQDIGTGTRTVLAVIVAEELGLKPSQIVVKLGNTEWPKGPGSGGSTTAPSLGPAARNAAWEVKRKLLSIASRETGIPEADLRMEGGAVRGRGRSLPFERVCARIEGEDLRAVGKRSGNYGAYQTIVHGGQFVEVEVDVETGQTRVLRAVAVQDAGRIISKKTFESQIIGGVIQGISYALFENRILDPHVGVQVNADFLTYKIAGPVDTPEIVPIAFDVANAGNNCGMMGLGEPPVIPTAAAIANAIFNATGRRLRSLPMTPDKILEALAARKR